MDELIELTSGDLQVKIAPPGTGYRASRFDWTTGVRQLNWQGTPYLTRENLELPGFEAQGWGLLGEFGIQTPVGYDECPVGGWFTKVGIGLLQRTDAGPYHFFRPYAIQPAHFEVQHSDNWVRFVGIQQDHQGWAWRLERQWSVRANQLTLVTRLFNSGQHRLSTEEYILNFLLWEPGCRLEVPVVIESQPLAEKVDPEQLLVIAGTTVEWKRPARQDYFLSRPALPAPKYWILHKPGTESWIREEVSFDPLRFNLWGRGHVVSPELFCAVDLEPGAECVTTRVWTFGHS